MSKSPANKPVKPVVPAKEQHDDDELIHTPRGTSRTQYLIVLGLMIFTLIIFTVGDSLQSSVARDQASGVAGMVWEHPEHGRQEIDYREFIDVKRQLDDYFRVQGRRSNISDEVTAVFILVNELARDAGIEITNGELAQAIMQGFGRIQSPEGPEYWSMFPMGTRENYDAYLASVGVSPPRFEETLRDIMRVRRFQTLTSAAATFPDSDEVLATWKEGHQEFAYDYVEFSNEAFLETAAAEVPSDEELQTWYEDLPARASVFREEMLQERIAAELAGFQVGGSADCQGLLERYPPPAELEPEELAREYYDAVRTSRFQRPTPLAEPEDSEDPENEDPEPIDPMDRIYFPFEEVRAEALAEAPIHKALVAWLADIQARVGAGETVDLGSEAADLGVFYLNDGVAREHSQWVELEGLGGNYMANGVRAAGFQPNMWSAALVADKTGLFLAHVLEKIPAGLPPMADIRERVVQEWTQERAGELALERAEELYATLAAAAGVALPADGAEPGAEVPAVVLDAETFQSTVAAAGFSVGRRDWLPGFTTQMFQFQGQSFPIPVPPTQFDPNAAEPANAYIDSQQSLEELAEGQVAEPALDDAKEHAFVVRFVGKRDPAEMRMSRDTFEELRATEALRLRREFEERYFSAENFGKLYGLSGFWNEQPSEEPNE